ncbi:MAG TPA: aminoglycoside phosphotransferase family protein [Anaerolineae bacterium]|nr:aminoglycoside phosphotransferase family protein [Anaerolineae bacterium]
MLEKPDIQTDAIVACLQNAYGLSVHQLDFLPLGADQNTAAYRIVAGDGACYFLKLRRGVFDETAVALPSFLRRQGIAPIIAPLPTTAGQLWASLDCFKLVLYPFVAGRDAYEAVLSDRQWYDLGNALQRIHAADLPRALLSRLRQETYAPEWRDIVRALLVRVEVDTFDDPVAANLAEFLTAQRDQILDLAGRAERLAQALQARPPRYVLCHGDVHAGNVLVARDDAIYIVDWDSPILAPKERDLMFFGGGQGFAGHSAPEEEILFYRGYGEAQIDPVALAYYRYERIIEDIAVFCQQLLLTNEGGQDRAQSLRYLKSNFLPNGTIDLAYGSDKAQLDG